LLDEPGRGIDIGAKADVYDVIRDVAARGAAVLVVASDMEELLLLSHRVVVLSEGKVTASLAGATLNRERVLEAAMSRARPTAAAERTA
jgi:ABC-type sugar transport system ATPase subunit